jgi:DnaJ-domain-containing protein 1
VNDLTGQEAVEQQATQAHRRAARQAVEILRQDPELAKNPETAEALLSTLEDGRVHLTPEVLVSLHQGAKEGGGDLVLAQEAAAETAELFGVSREQFFEALESGTDLNLDLNRGLARALNEPHLEAIIDQITAEPSQVIKERASEIERLINEDDPFAGLGEAEVKEVKPETVR